MATAKKILITGAEGFSGKHLTKLLSSDTSLDLTLSARAVPKTPDSRFHVCDFSDSTAVMKLIEVVRPDEVYHLIGSFTNVYETDYAGNLLTAKHLLDAIRAAKIKARVLLIGSTGEYGNPSGHERAVKETDPLAPVSVYGLTKVYQSHLMGLYVRLYGMDIVMARTFNLFGKGMSPILLCGNVEQEIGRYKRGEIQTIETGDLSVERDYIAIEQAVGYYRAIMERGKTGEVYNVGSGRSTPLRDMVTTMLAQDGLSLDIVREQSHSVPGKLSVRKIFADISKLKQLF